MEERFNTAESVLSPENNSGGIINQNYSSSIYQDNDSNNSLENSQHKSVAVAHSLAQRSTAEEAHFTLFPNVKSAHNSSSANKSAVLPDSAETFGSFAAARSKPWYLMGEEEKESLLNAKVDKNPMNHLVPSSNKDNNSNNSTAHSTKRSLPLPQQTSQRQSKVSKIASNSKETAIVISDSDSSDSSSSSSSSSSDNSSHKHSHSSKSSKKSKKHKKSHKSERRSRKKAKGIPRERPKSVAGDLAAIQSMNLNAEEMKILIAKLREQREAGS
jgi:hypothetical protein